MSLPGHPEGEIRSAQDEGAPRRAAPYATWPKWSKDQIAARVAQDIEEGMVVNLGIGMPTLVANHLPAGREVLMHSENGVIGIGPAPAAGEEDFDLINAGKQPVTLLPGGVYFHHADSFAMMRGGHLDLCVLGAFQVSAGGDLANWHTGEPGAIPAVGGAMDLAIGAKQTYVMMEHVSKAGAPKLVAQCSYPLTGVACVRRVYTDLAVLEITSDGLRVLDSVPGLSFEALQSVTQAPLLRASLMVDSGQA
jgi:3-oxoadipate CoA-transferase, beta subunit